jgi:mono/diheme cytochrome c family protein
MYRLQEITMTRAMLVAVLGVVIATMPAAAQQPNDVADGRELALQVCTFCHVVTTNQQFPPILQPPAPTFRSIAGRQNTTAASLSTFLHLPHKDLPMPAEMPNLQLSDEQIGKLVSYILSLRGQQ